MQSREILKTRARNERHRKYFKSSVILGYVANRVPSEWNKNKGILRTKIMLTKNMHKLLVEYLMSNSEYENVV